jgi:hypothetical protein
VHVDRIFLMVAEGSFQDRPIEHRSGTNDPILSATVSDNLLALLALLAVILGLLVCGILIQKIRMCIEHRRRMRGAGK